MRTEHRHPERSEGSRNAMRRASRCFVPLLLSMTWPLLAQEKTILIRNATVLTITNGTIENGSVLIRGTKIAAVGKDIAAPANAQVIDATGKFVMPGIIDTHSHTGVEGSVNEISLPNTGMVRI